MGSYENIFTSYDQGAFKFASRNFYSEFLAAMRVASRMENNRKFPFEQPEATLTLQLKEDTPAKRIQSSFRVSAESFSRLNPALLRPVLDGEKMIPRGYLVRLPANKNKTTVKKESFFMLQGIKSIANLLYFGTGIILSRMTPAQIINSACHTIGLCILATGLIDLKSIVAEVLLQLFQYCS